MKHFWAGGKTGWVHLFGPGEAPRPLVWLMAGEMTEERLLEMETLILPVIEQGGCIPFALAGFEPVSWDHDYAPWPLETPDGRCFGGGAQALLSFSMRHFLPEAEKHFLSDGRRYVVGYSLGGLAALFFAGLESWDGCASCSGSLWYPGFLSWLKAHPPRCPVYLSLGGREKNTRDPLMAQVEDCTRAAFDLLRPVTKPACVGSAVNETSGLSPSKTAFVLEPGGHFRGTAQRLSHALLWLMDARQLRKD